MPVSQVLRHAGRAFLTLDVLARLPVAMFPLGILLLVAERTGSFGQGGLAVAALSLGGAVGGPLVGGLADRLGQRPVALAAIALQVAALSALLVVDLPLLTPVLVAAIGVGNPQSGAMARSRWAAYARPRPDRARLTSGAMAFEGAVDETSFVLGPMLVGTVAGLTSPTVALALALGLGAVAQTGFALHRSALPAGRTTSGSARPRPLPRLHLGAVLVAAASIGVVFGITQTGVAGRLQLTGDEGLTGVVYGAMGVGSAVTAVLTTHLPERLSHEARVVVSGLLLTATGAVAAAAGTPLLLAGANLLIGIAIAPALVTGYALAERAAPEGRGTAVMTAIATANVVGVAGGAAIAGRLVDGAGATAALLGDCVAGVVLLLAGLAAAASRPRTHEITPR